MELDFIWYWLGLSFVAIATGMVVIAVSRGQRFALNLFAIALVVLGVALAALSVVREPLFVLLFAIVLGVPVAVANLLGARRGASRAGGV